MRVAKKRSRNIEDLAERRRTARYPIREEVRYKLLHSKTEIVGAGNTLNMGSGGVLFTTEQHLPIGGTVEVAVNWPARLDGTCPLQFVAKGRVIRSENDCAAITIERHELRTLAASLTSCEN